MNVPNMIRKPLPFKFVDAGGVVHTHGYAPRMAMDSAENLPGNLRELLMQARIEVEGKELKLTVGDETVSLPLPEGLALAGDDEPSRADNDDARQPVGVAADRARLPRMTAADLFRPSVTNPARSVHDLFPSHIRRGGR